MTQKRPRLRMALSGYGFSATFVVSDIFALLLNKAAGEIKIFQRRKASNEENAH